MVKADKVAEIRRKYDNNQISRVEAIQHIRELLRTTTTGAADALDNPLDYEDRL